MFINVVQQHTQLLQKNAKAKHEDVLELKSKSLKNLKQQVKDELVRNRRCEFCKHAGLIIQKRAKIYRRSLKTLMLEIFIPLILLLTGFSFSKIQFIFASEPREVSPDFYDGEVHRLMINKNVVNPPSDVELEERVPYDEAQV